MSFIVISFIDNCLVIYQIQMQFPNCTAKVSVLSECTKRRYIFRMFYNIVLEFESIVYTCKHSSGSILSTKNKPPKRRNASMVVSFKHL